MTTIFVDAGELMARRSGSVDPSRFPDEEFELHSIPAFDAGKPEVLRGDQIGSTKQLVAPNDVMISKIVPHIRRSTIVPEFTGRRQIASGEWIVFRDTKFFPDYLRHFLTSNHFHARFMKTVSGVGGSLLRARPAEVAKIKIPLPPLVEQRRLAGLLSHAEGIVRLRREAQRKAAELVPALFLDMFGDPASNPKGWQTVALSEVSSVGSGAGFPIADQGRDSGDYPFYKVGDMNLPGNEEVMVSSRNYIDEVTRSRLRATAFPPGAVIFPKIGAAIATNKKRVLSIPSCVDNNVMAVVPSDRLLSSYLHALFMHADLSDFASDSNPPSIRKTTVEAWRVPLPPVDLQRQFAAKADAVRGIAAQQTAALATAQATFDALLHQSFAVS